MILQDANRAAVVVTVIAPGTAVNSKTFGGVLPGTVVDASIGMGGHVMYNVAWWDGRDRRSGWMHDFEVEPTTGSAPSIGFTFCGGEIRS